MKSSEEDFMITIADRIRIKQQSGKR